MIEKSYTDEEIAEIVRKHGLPRYPCDATGLTFRVTGLNDATGLTFRVTRK